MKSITILAILVLSVLKLNAQITDSLMHCGRAPYFLVVHFSKDKIDNQNVKFTFEQGGSKFTYKNDGNANFNWRYSKLELTNYLNSNNSATNYYRLVLDDSTIYIPDTLLQNFVDEFLEAKKSKINKEVYLDKYFTSDSNKKYLEDRKNNLPKYNNGYCSNRLNASATKSVVSSLALTNVLLEKKNEAIVSVITNDKITVKASKGADFSPDLDYYVIGKPSLIIRFKMNKNNTNLLEAIVKNDGDNKDSIIKLNDVITNVKQE